MFVLEAESADEWETVVSGCFVPLRCAGFEQRFTGRMEHAQLDERISVSLVTTCGTSAERTERLASGSAAADDVHISLQRASRGTVMGDGSVTSVRAGSVSVYATDRPYYLDYSPSGQQQLIVQVSRRSLGLPDGMMEATMRRLALPGGIRGATARGLFSYVADLPAGVSPDETAAVTRDLASSMIRSSFQSGSVTPRTSSGLRHVVQQFLRENLGQRGLNMDEVAARHFVSRRRLYQAFEKDGTTPGAYLRTERMRRASAMLVDPAHRRTTIEQIAYACGFDDTTTFTRAFRRAYGRTPREWRIDASSGSSSRG